MRMRGLPTLLAAALVALAEARPMVEAASKTCFELPIVILSPPETATEGFPEINCVQPPLPSEDCMKRPVDVTMEVIDRPAIDDHPLVNCLEDTAPVLYRARTHYRGQSSLRFKKHQYSVKLDEPGELLGFPTDRSFVFNGPMIDGSLIRNHLAHALFRATGRYSPRTRHIVLFVRDLETREPVYQGIYLALEAIGYGPNRVGLAPLTNACDGDELSGGWAWQLNPLNYGVYSPNIVGDQYQLMFGAGERPVLMHPKPEDLTQTMRDYFVRTTTGPLPRLYRYLFYNASHTDELETHIDLGSFVDYMLHSELSQNSDAYRRSTYFFKDRNQPINAGPVWDFNLAYGLGANQPDWLFKPFMLWKRLLTNYKMVSLTIQRWRVLRKDVWSDAALIAFIDNSTAPLERQLRPCKRWFSKEIPCARVKVRGDYASHVNRVKQAVLGRAKWMDDNIVSLYARVNAAVWNPAPPPPEYNCGPNGTDAGCLTDPEAYVMGVPFPPLRKTQSELVCTGIHPAERVNTSIDPCWLSAGVYTTDGSITPFCSGNGFCPAGPNKTCTCIRGHQPPLCGHQQFDMHFTSLAQKPAPKEEILQLKSHWSDVPFALVLFWGALVAVAVAHRRTVGRNRRSRVEAVPILTPTASARQRLWGYGT